MSWLGPSVLPLKLSRVTATLGAPIHSSPRPLSETRLWRTTKGVGCGEGPHAEAAMPRRPVEQDFGRRASGLGRDRPFDSHASCPLGLHLNGAETPIEDEVRVRGDDDAEVADPIGAPERVPRRLAGRKRPADVSPAGGVG